MFIFAGFAALSILLIYSLFASSYRLPFILSILLSPVIASTWKYKFFGISMIDLFFVLFILVFVVRLLMKKEKLYEIPYQNFFLLYIFVLIFVSIKVNINAGILSAIEFFAKSIYSPFCFYVGATYFSRNKDLKSLFLSFILAVIFPLIFIFIQIATGYTWRFHETRGLIRAQGVYHDVVSARIFIIQALIGIFLYWHYFLNKERRLRKAFFVLLLVLSGTGLYFLYSKAIVVTLVLWLLLFSFLRKRIYALPLAFGIFALLNSLTDSRILLDMRTLFSREIEYAEGKISSDYVLAGRGGIWKQYSKEWKKLPILEKLTGTGESHTYFHNDFLRVLYSGGVLLLFLYGGMLLFLVVKIFSCYVAQAKTIYFVTLLGLAYYLAETLGQLPGFYPIIQPFTWGLAGVALKQDLTSPENNQGDLSLKNGTKS